MRHPRKRGAALRGMEFRSVPVLGVSIADIGLPEVLDVISNVVENPRPSTYLISYANAHICNLAWSDAGFRETLARMDLVYVDGNGPRLAAWLAGRRLPRRMTGADWIDELCRLCKERSYSLYLVGAADGVARQAAERLATKHSGLRVRGSHPGYFDPTELERLTADIRALRPDILLLGMASPVQERWMVDHARDLGVPVVWGVGGLFEYASGRLRRAPGWMRRLGLEWLGRLLIEPRRLGRRYVFGLPLFLLRALREASNLRLQRVGPARTHNQQAVTDPEDRS